MEMIKIYFFIFLGVVIFLVIVILMIIWGVTYGTPKERAGRQGEKRATEIIKQVLREDDILFTNVCIDYEEKEAELDNVIINRKGVFIVEVKNYSGELVGKEDDYEWVKYKTSRGGNIYSKQVRNPIKQVRRQVYILAHYLKSYGINVWVEGYVLLVNNNSPVHNGTVLESLEEIDHAIHSQSCNSLGGKNVIEIKKLLSERV